MLNPVLQNFVLSLIRRFRNLLVATGLVKRKYEAEFTRIFHARYWGSEESVSGGGSAFEATEVVRHILPLIIQKESVRSLLDIPCGDFNWMQSVSLVGVEYTGCDVVPALVAKNKQSYQRKGVRFLHLDLINDRLPAADLVLCRDCLVHLPLTDAVKALRNVVRSGSKWLLTTTFTDRMHNADIAAGKWRPLNLQIKPFCLPEPEGLFNEECTEADGKYADKSLGLWSCRSIRDALG